METLQEGTEITLAGFGVAGNSQVMDAVLRLPKRALVAEPVSAVEALGNNHLLP